MVQTVDVAFVRQFEGEIHHIVQREGSKLRGMVRTRTGVTGTSTNFPIAGTGVAGSKSRHGVVPIMNAERLTVQCNLADRYAGEYVDKLDLLKIQHDERQVVATTIGNAMGRDFDNIIIQAASLTTNPANVATPTAWTTAAGPLSVLQTFLNTDAFEEGMMAAVVPPKAWIDLMSVPAFASADFINDKVYDRPMMRKSWLSFDWVQHTGLNVVSADSQALFMHKNGVGHAIGADFSLDVTWSGERQAWLAVGSASHGAVVIENARVLSYRYDL